MKKCSMTRYVWRTIKFNTHISWSGLLSWTQWTEIFNTTTNELYSLLLCVSSESVVTAESTYTLSLCEPYFVSLGRCDSLRICLFVFYVIRYHIHMANYLDVRNLLSLLLPSELLLLFIIVIATAGGCWFRCCRCWCLFTKSENKIRKISKAESIKKILKKVNTFLLLANY